MPRLRRSRPYGPGIRRESRGNSERFISQDGREITDEATLERIRALVIPPAWTDVWIADDELGHIQAVGTDQAGRKQYLYHDVWRQQRDRVKFDRALVLAGALPTARRSVSRDLNGSGLTQRRALAAAFQLVDRSALRIGSEEYLRQNGSHGLITLQARHVIVGDQGIELIFPAKSGKEWHSIVTDPGLTAFLAEMKVKRRASARMLAWRDTSWHALTSTNVNDDIRERTRAELTAKDFRTLRGTIVAAQALARSGIPESEKQASQAITAAVQATADVLGNTTAVARKSYVDPRLFDQFRAGRVLDLRRSPEAALRSLLEG